MRESYLSVVCESRRETMQSFPCSSVLSGIHLASSLALHLFLRTLTQGPQNCPFDQNQRPSLLILKSV